jgi:hypothetical protein
MPLPPSTAAPVQAAWPRQPPSVTPSTSLLAASPMVAIWLRSPHSARKVSVNTSTSTGDSSAAAARGGTGGSGGRSERCGAMRAAAARGAAGGASALPLRGAWAGTGCTRRPSAREGVLRAPHPCRCASLCSCPWRRSSPPRRCRSAPPPPGARAHAGCGISAARSAAHAPRPRAPSAARRAPRSAAPRRARAPTLPSRAPHAPPPAPTRPPPKRRRSDTACAGRRRKIAQSRRGASPWATSARRDAADASGAARAARRAHAHARRRGVRGSARGQRSGGPKCGVRAPAPHQRGRGPAHGGGQRRHDPQRAQRARKHLQARAACSGASRGRRLREARKMQPRHAPSAAGASSP